MELREYNCQDIWNPEYVEIHISENGFNIWVNVEGVCLLRATHIIRLVIKDDRNANR